jgi:hypothetical protein
MRDATAAPSVRAFHRFAYVFFSHKIAQGHALRRPSPRLLIRRHRTRLPDARVACGGLLPAGAELDAE